MTGLAGRSAPALLLAGFALVFVLQVAGFHGLRHDDAYITYRYGQNLVAGRGFVFNPGERVLGSTAPGHALLAAAVYRVAGRDATPTAMAVLGCLGWTGQAAAVLWLLRPALGVGAVAVAGAVAVGAAGSAAWVALETNLAVAFALSSLVLARSGRWTAAGATVGIASFLRPDGLVMALLLVGLGWTRDRRAAGRLALAAGALPLAWAAFATWYFGSPLPRSAVVKVGRVGVGDYVAHELGHLAGAWISFDLAWVGLTGAWLVAALGTVRLLSRDGALWPLPAYGALQLAAYATLRPVLLHTWHLYPAELVFVVLATSALADLAAAGRSRVPRALGAVALVGLLAVHAASTTRFARDHADAYWNGARDAVYRAAAADLARRAGPGDVVAGIEVGTLAYYSDLRMHDWTGLVTRDPGRLPAATRWIVMDLAYAPRFAGLPVVGTFEHGPFGARVFAPVTDRNAMSSCVRNGRGPVSGLPGTTAPR